MAEKNPVRTGFEGYCKAAAMAFGECFPRGTEQAVFEGAPLRRFYAITPEIRFGMELFGYERFFTSSDMRLQTWRLKGTNRGRLNRFSVFQNLWLSDSTRKRSVRLDESFEDIKDMLTSVDGLNSWRREQERLLKQAFSSRIQHDDLPRITMNGIGENARRVVEQISRRQTEGRQHFSAEHTALLDSQVAWIHDFTDYLETAGNEEPVARENLVAIADWLGSLGQKLKQDRKGLLDRRSELMADKQILDAICPREAIANCVDTMLSDETPALIVALHEFGYEFANKFSAEVLPTIRQGFRAEGYMDTRINAFVRSIDALANKLLPLNRPESTARKRAYQAFRDFAEKLVISLVYGPEPRGFGSSTSYVNTPASDFDTPAGSQIIVSQLFSPRFDYMGRTAIYTANDVILLGRCDVADAYRDKYEEAFPPHEEKQKGVQEKTLQVFPISEEHIQVSNLHGALVNENGTWIFRDFSRFGTRLTGNGKDGDGLDVCFQEAFHEIEAGNTLFLGARPEDKDIRILYHSAAAIRLSYYVDEDNRLYES